MCSFNSKFINSQFATLDNTSTFDEDIEAARHPLFQCPRELDHWFWNLSWWMDPVLLGHYPEKGLRIYEKYLPKITDEDIKEVLERLSEKLNSPLLYGGSVKVDNIKAILSIPKCSGVLVGTASWNVQDFSHMIQTADELKK